MSKTCTRVLAIMGIVSGLGVASLPLGTVTASATDSETLTITASVDTVISVTLDSGTISPSDGVTPGGAVVTATGTITVSTNNTNGYTLSIADSDSNNSLCQAASGNACAYYIPATSSGNAVATGNSAWGIQGDSTTVSAFNSGVVAVPTSATILKTRSGIATDDTTTVTYSFSARTDQPSGSYTDSIVYTASVSGS